MLTRVGHWSCVPHSVPWDNAGFSLGFACLICAHGAQAACEMTGWFPQRAWGLWRAKVIGKYGVAVSLITDSRTVDDVMLAAGARTCDGPGGARLCRGEPHHAVREELGGPRQEVVILGRSVHHCLDHRVMGLHLISVKVFVFEVTLPFTDAAVVFRACSGWMRATCDEVPIFKCHGAVTEVGAFSRRTCEVASGTDRDRDADRGTDKGGTDTERHYTDIETHTTNQPITRPSSASTPTKWLSLRCGDLAFGP